jgi:hypothetical protein
VESKSIVWPFAKHETIGHPAECVIFIIWAGDWTKLAPKPTAFNFVNGFWAATPIEDRFRRVRSNHDHCANVARKGVGVNHSSLD